MVTVFTETVGKHYHMHYLPISVLKTIEFLFLLLITLYLSSGEFNAHFVTIMQMYFNPIKDRVEFGFNSRAFFGVTQPTPLSVGDFSA